MLIRLKYIISYVLISFLTITLFSGNQSGAQDIAIIPNKDAPIPEGYKSWSLFLINNPEWILPEKNDDLKMLFEQFKAFGNAIGPEHLAVWFWGGESMNPWETLPADTKNVDFLRSSAFCSQLKLPPGKSPYIILTTDYPGEALLSSYPQSFNKLQNYSVIELNSLSADEITDVLKNLADQLVTEDISNLSQDSENYWKTWQKTYEAARDNLVSLFKKINISINTSFFKFEIKGDD